MRNPKLIKIIEILEKGKEFCLTRQEYIRLTGADIPQSKYYTEKSSAIARRAKSYGFKVVVIPEIIKFEKTKGENNEKH